MKFWQSTAAAMCLLATGCVSKQELRCANQMLERENFHLEEKLDQAGFEIDDLKSELELARRQRDTLPYDSIPVERRPSGGPTRAPSLPQAPEFRPPSAPDGGDRAPKVVLPGEEQSAGTLIPRERAPRFDGPPLISPPSPSVPEGILPRGAQPPRAGKPVSLAPGGKALPTHEPELAPEPTEVLEPPPPDEPQSSRSRGAGSAARLVARSGDDKLAALAVNAKATVWRKTSGPERDELIVVVEPRNTAGELVEVAGDVSVAMLDPSRDGKDARVARWDFPAEQLADHFQGTQPGGGLRFALRWPGDPPSVNQLELYVRLTLEDGRQFVAESTLEATTVSSSESTASSAAPGATGWRRAAGPRTSSRPQPPGRTWQSR